MPKIVVLYNIIRYVTNNVVLSNNSGSLADIANMHGFSLSEKEVLVIFKQVLEGLCFIHEKGIIHRDIKCKCHIFI